MKQQTAMIDNLFMRIFDSTANLRRFIHEEDCDHLPAKQS